MDQALLPLISTGTKVTEATYACVEEGGEEMSLRIQTELVAPSSATKTASTSFS